MEIVGDRRFVELPGAKTHELPPLLVKTLPPRQRLDRMVETASEMIEQEDMVPILTPDQLAQPEGVARRKMDLAIQLVDRYMGLLGQWHWGDAVLEWIRQCEITFCSRLELRNLLQNDLWPHAGRSSFVTLLEDKGIAEKNLKLPKAVGLRLAFRQMPPMRCCSDQFLFYLNNNIAQSAYQTWFDMTPSPVSSLPPERFEFEVVNMSLEIH